MDDSNFLSAGCRGHCVQQASTAALSSGIYGILLQGPSPPCPPSLHGPLWVHYHGGASLTDVWAFQVDHAKISSSGYNYAVFLNFLFNGNNYNMFIST